MAKEVQRTLTMAETIQTLIDAKLIEVHTGLPAKIVSYDISTNMAVVKPLLKRKYKAENNSIELPTISNVPVAFPRMGEAFLRLPVNPGDEGKISFCERSIDKWLSQGGVVTPDDPRRFNISDAVFELGLTSQINIMNVVADPKSLELKNKDSYIEILDNGKFKITDGTNELFDILVQLLVDLKTATDAIGVPFNGATIAKFELLRIKLDAMKG